MTNLQDLTLFSKEAFLSNRYLKFLETDLGKLYQSIPFSDLASLLPEKTTNVGAPSTFSYEGFFGLMFLKAYLNLSDEKLIDRINTDWALQYFCGIQLSENKEIKDGGMPSRIRIFLAEHLDIEGFQRTLINNWSADMEGLGVMLNDATAFESYIKFPTDVKLLWDCVNWVYNVMHVFCKEMKIKRPRSKFNEQKIKQLSYQKCRKKNYKITKRRKKSLLYLLNKGLGQLKEVLALAREKGLGMKEKHAIRLIYIKEVYRQQKYMFDNNTNSVANRIVSLFKHYIRPIKRGKENKPVEFGAKVAMSQVDGIDLIDRLSFDAFNEAKELKSSVIKHEQRFGACRQVGVDAIYGTNENRKWMKSKNIFHSCVPKGRASAHKEQEKILRKELGKERSTVLEGSFGNVKNHYGLAKIKARTETTEIAWIFFGVMCANAVKIAKRRYKKEQKETENKEKQFLIPFQ
jgi:hypothetical protein